MRTVIQLPPEEPAAGPWRAKRQTVVTDTLIGLGANRRTRERTVMLAVDGRSSSGKTTLAARVQAAVPESVVVHTDDLAWWHSRFGWADLPSTAHQFSCSISNAHSFVQLADKLACAVVRIVRGLGREII